ncbi:MAG: hypothetical protein ACE5EY_06695 [Anaerolineae bacterium]
MQERPILIIEPDSLLGESIRQVLGSEKNLQVISVSPQSESQLIEEFNLNRPNTIILSQASRFLRPIVNWFRNCRDCDHVQLILISPFNNEVEIYKKSNLQTTKARDLVQLVQNHHSSKDSLPPKTTEPKIEQKNVPYPTFTISQHLKH